MAPNNCCLLLCPPATPVGRAVCVPRPGCSTHIMPAETRQGHREVGRGATARRPALPSSLPCHPSLSQLSLPWPEDLLDSRLREFSRWACDHQTSTQTASPKKPVGEVCSQSMAFLDVPAERRHRPGYLKCSNGARGALPAFLAQGSQAGTASPSAPPLCACPGHY